MMLPTTTSHISVLGCTPFSSASLRGLGLMIVGPGPGGYRLIPRLISPAPPP